MRRAILLLTLLAACEPEFTAESYYCGEQMSCPPTLVCDGISAKCVYPQDVQHFICPDFTNADEPDDTVADAVDFGEAGCGSLAPMYLGCIDNATDVDHLAIHVGCDDIDFRLRFAYAFAPLQIDLLDPGGAVTASGELCEPTDATARSTVCLSTVLAPGDYYVRVQIAEGAPVCDGLCDFNDYTLSLL